MAFKSREPIIGIYRGLARVLIALIALLAAASALNPVPLIYQPLVPDATKPGGAGFTLTVNGTGFVSGSVVKWNGSARATAFIGKSQLKATILASDIAKPGTASVTVINPSPGGGTSNVAFFEVTWPGPSIGLTRADYGTGSASDSVVVGDFNRDGKLDVAVANSSSDNISVLLGNGDGTFRPAVNYSAGSGPNSVAVGDFNRDGKLDLVVLDRFNVGVLIGNGDGTFQPPVFSNAGPFHSSFAVADFNGDGKLDLVVAFPETGELGVLLGNGDGTFQLFGSFFLAGTNSVAVGDFNGDGKLDLATAAGGGVGSGYGTITILLGNGDGTFQYGKNYYVGGIAPTSVAIGDFNGDGKLDLAVSNSLSGNVSVFMGFGDGTFNGPVNYGVGTQPVSVAIGDFNGDGKLDLAVANEGSNSVSVLVGNGDGTFQAHQDYGTGSSPASVAVGDFDRSGRLDLAVAALNVASVLLQSPLSPASLTFGTRLVGTTGLAQSATITNYRSVALSISSISITGADSGDFTQTNTCGSSITPGASCTINVTFGPAQIGARTANLSVTDSALGSPQTVALSGAGTEVELNPSSLSFGCSFKVHTCPPPPQSTMLTNVGSTALTITSITISGQGFSENNNCPSTLGPSKSCTITVHFNVKTFGLYKGAVSVSDDGGGSPQQVALSANAKPGMGPAALSALSTTSTVAVPGPTGPSDVGTRIVQMVDPLRDDPFMGNGTKREVMVRFWYPASTSEGCEPAEYTSPEVWSYFSELTGFALPEVRTSSCLDAPVSEGSHPVVVFTPGYTGTFTDYTYLFEDLASRGYVVAAVDHTYEATAVEFPDGRFVKSVFGSHLAESTWRRDEESLSLAASVRLKDLKFVADELRRLNEDQSGPFAGRLDLNKVAIAGHSLGGWAAWLDATHEPRFKAAVLLDATMLDPSSSATETAVLMFAMGRTEWSDQECRLWRDLRGPRLAVNLKGAEHVTPSDAVWLAKGAVRTGPMGTDKTIEALRDYIAAFLDANLQGRPLDPLLTGPSSIFPDAEVTTQKQALCSESAAH